MDGKTTTESTNVTRLWDKHAGVCSSTGDAVGDLVPFTMQLQQKGAIPSAATPSAARADPSSMPFRSQGASVPSSGLLTMVDLYLRVLGQYVFMCLR